MLAATNTFGSAMTGKTDEIVSYVQQQTDRLSQVIDGKRGSLVEAIGAKTNQLTVEIDRVTSDALKSIETRGQAFSQSMMGNGNDVARTITSAGETRHRRAQPVAEGARAVLAAPRSSSRARSRSRPSPRCRKPRRSCVPTRWRCSSGCAKATSCCRKC